MHKLLPFLPTFLISGPVPAPQLQLSIAPKQQRPTSLPATPISISYQHVAYVSSELAPPKPSHKMSGRILTTSPLVAAMPHQRHPPTALYIHGLPVPLRPLLGYSNPGLKLHKRHLLNRRRADGCQLLLWLLPKVNLQTSTSSLSHHTQPNPIDSVAPPTNLSSSMNYPLSVVPSSSTFTTTTRNPAPTSPTTNATATVTTTPTASPSKNTFLSPAAGAGIGITFAGILLIAGIVIFYVHRHHVHRQQATVGTRLPDDVGVAADRRTSGPPPSYPTMQEIDGKTVYNIVLRERPPEPPAAAVIRDVSDSSNASTLNETPTARSVYEMDGRRPWSFGRSLRTSQHG